MGFEPWAQAVTLEGVAEIQSPKPYGLGLRVPIQLQLLNRSRKSGGQVVGKSDPTLSPEMGVSKNRGP